MNTHLTNLPRLAASFCFLLVLITACKKSQDEIFLATPTPLPVENPESPASPTPPSEKVYVKNDLTIGNSKFDQVIIGLGNRVFENFWDCNTFYLSYDLNFIKEFPARISRPNGEVVEMKLSYGIHFRLFTVNNFGETIDYTVEMLDDILPYYQALNREYAKTNKAIAYLYGDSTLQSELTETQYIDYMKSQVRIAEGTLHIKYLEGRGHQVSFSGISTENDSIFFTGTTEVDTYWGGDGSFWIGDLESAGITTNPEASNVEINGMHYYQGGTRWVEEFHGQKYLMVSSHEIFYNYRIDPNGVIARYSKVYGMMLAIPEKEYGDPLPNRKYYCIPGGSKQLIEKLKLEEIPGLISDSTFIGYYYQQTDIPPDYYTPIYLTQATDPKEVSFSSGSLAFDTFDGGWGYYLLMKGTLIDENNIPVIYNLSAIY